MAHLPFLFCDDRICDDEFVTTEFVTSQRTGLLPDTDDPARSFLKQQLGDQTATASLRDVTTNAMICENYL
ncbi:MAG TPA: hypothetical protein VF835_03945 [Rhizomicrobium sp.]